MSNLWVPRQPRKRQGKKRTWYTAQSPADNPIMQAMFASVFAHMSRIEAVYDATDLHVIIAEEQYPPDTRHWLHLSISREDRYPTWEELLDVKDEFIGEEAEAFQVLPKQSEYVSVHPNCFHIFHCIDGDLMPH